MSSKIYKVSGDHLNALGEAAGIIVAFLESIKADDALLNFSAAQALMNIKHAAKELETAIDENAERRLAELDKRRTADKTPCHCHCVKGDKYLVAVCPKPKKPAKKSAPLPKTIKEIAAATGATYKQVHKYAYSHGIGTATRTADGHQCRTFTEDEVKAILAHFKK